MSGLRKILNSRCCIDLVVVFMLMGAFLENTQARAAAKPIVTVSVEPVALLVRELCADDCDVVSMVPRGVSEHSWQPGPKDIARFKSSIVLIGIGLKLDERWFKALSIDPSLVLWVGDKLSPEPWWSDGLNLTEHDEHEDDRDHHHDHDHGPKDPHIWTDAVRMGQLAGIVQMELAKKIPAQALQFDLRAKKIQARLANLQQQVEAKKSHWKVRPVVMFHDTAGYFARRLQLPVLSVSEGSTGHDLSAKMIAGMSKRFKAVNIAAVMVEREDGAAKSLARELKTTVKVVDFAANQSYAHWDDWFLKIVTAWDDIMK
jgi:zinc transport system substrate-binding protein